MEIERLCLILDGASKEARANRENMPPSHIVHARKSWSQKNKVTESGAQGGGRRLFGTAEFLDIGLNPFKRSSPGKYGGFSSGTHDGMTYKSVRQSSMKLMIDVENRRLLR